MQDKARVATVKFGNLEIEGLRWVDEDGTVNYGVAVPQLAAKSVVPPNRSTKQLEALLGESFQSLKKSSELNPKPVNVLNSSDFSKVIVAAAFKGNPVAQEMIYVLTGASVETLFADAFGDTQTPPKIARRF